MKLYDNWREILKKAWSIRFMAMAWFASVAEFLAPSLLEGMPRGLFAALSATFAMLGIWSRTVYQKSIEKGV